MSSKCSHTPTTYRPRVVAVVLHAHTVCNAKTYNRPNSWCHQRDKKFKQQILSLKTRELLDLTWERRAQTTTTTPSTRHTQRTPWGQPVCFSMCVFLCFSVCVVCRCVCVFSLCVDAKCSTNYGRLRYVVRGVRFLSFLSFFSCKREKKREREKTR
jgi:hypothetical protein